MENQKNDNLNMLEAIVQNTEMAKLNTKVSIGMKTITDKSTRNLAEMLTQGSGMGVVDCIKSQKDYPDAAPGSKRLMQKLQDFEEDNRLKLEQYL